MEAESEGRRSQMQPGKQPATGDLCRPVEDMIEELTDRELAILRTLPGSATQREIGAALYLSLNTIKAYNKNLYRKLGVNSRHDAVAVARQLGLI